MLDICTDGLALCEAARRASVDYSDADAMRARFGGDALRLGSHAPDARPPLTVLNVPVPVGGTRTMTVPVRLTLRDPPASVPGAARAVQTAAGYRAALRACAADPAPSPGWWTRCPSRSRRCFTASRAQSWTWWGTRRRASRG